MCCRTVGSNISLAQLRAKSGEELLQAAAKFNRGIRSTKPVAMAGTVPASELGTRHAGEIDDVFQALKSKDERWAEIGLQSVGPDVLLPGGFVKGGNPNGKGLAEWPAYKKGDGYQTMPCRARRQ